MLCTLGGPGHGGFAPRGKSMVEATAEYGCKRRCPSLGVLWPNKLVRFFTRSDDLTRSRQSLIDSRVPVSSNL